MGSATVAHGSRKLFEPQSRPPDGDWEDGPAFLEVTSGGEAVEFPVAFANPASN